ncbi:hypothetical protein [Neobacillus cucumis]|uniref:hypothetical protein n=1 Tax=Neobacillus cucumis TaxID=1740721 RepID=UPI001962544B|nr:hypothetical protein [Neobacillus cucumis]
MDVDFRFWRSLSAGVPGSLLGAKTEGTEKVLFCLIMKFPKNLIPKFHRFPISKWGNSVYFTTNYKLEVGMGFSGISFALNFTDFFSGLAKTPVGSPHPRTPAGVERLPLQSTSFQNQQYSLHSLY